MSEKQDKKLRKVVKRAVTKAGVGMMFLDLDEFREDGKAMFARHDNELTTLMADPNTTTDDINALADKHIAEMDRSKTDFIEGRTHNITEQPYADNHGVETDGLHTSTSTTTDDIDEVIHTGEGDAQLEPPKDTISPGHTPGVSDKDRGIKPGKDIK